MLILAFDTATSLGATCALVRDGEVLATGWRASARDVAAAIDEIVPEPGELDAIVVGTGPGSFTSIRIAIATARGLGLGLGVPAAGVSTLDGFEGGEPVIDARRGEVFSSGPRVCVPEELKVEGRTLVGDGALRYRELFEAAGATIPADDADVHRPSPALLAARAGAFGPAEAVEPIYLRVPDAERKLP